MILLSARRVQLLLERDDGKNRFLEKYIRRCICLPSHHVVHVDLQGLNRPLLRDVLHHVWVPRGHVLYLPTPLYHLRKGM